MFIDSIYTVYSCILGRRNILMLCQYNAMACLPTLNFWGMKQEPHIYFI